MAKHHPTTHCSYHDYANEVPLPNEVGDAELSPQEKSRKGVCASVSVFPLRLHEMLADLEREGLSYMASWQPHGRCFAVHNQPQFVKHVLPKYFKQSKIASFQRQLNLYGFVRMSSGPDKGCYYHELFLRGKEFLAIRIKRTKVKGTYTRKPSSPQSEPKFYNLPSLPATTQKKALRAEGAGGIAPALPFISLRASPDSFSNGDSFPERIASRRASSSFASSQPKPADTTTPEEEALRMLTNRGTLAQIMAVDPSTSSSTVPNSIFPQQQQQQLSLVAHPPPTIPPDLLYRESVASSSSSSGRPERLQQQQAEQPTSRDCAAALPPIVLAQPTNNNTFFSVTSSVDLSLALLSKLYGQGGR